MEEIRIDGRTCLLVEHPAADGSCGPLILWGTYPGQGEIDEESEIRKELSALTELIEEQLPDTPYSILAYPCESWNRDFSPWPSDPVFGREAFEGGGEAMLSWLTQDCLSELSRLYDGRYAETPVYLAGYSLAGLFSLWALYESRAFAGAACCSGSLWFPGWADYARQHPISPEAIVYLSLGGKEEKTKNPVMATIGQRMREQEQLLKGRARAVRLEWNPGGHFADSVRRIAKGMIWLLKN